MASPEQSSGEVTSKRRRAWQIAGVGAAALGLGVAIFNGPDSNDTPPPPNSLIFNGVGGCHPERDIDKINPNLRELLEKLAKEHEITVSCLISGHSPGGPHPHGMAADIQFVDGQEVSHDIADAKENKGKQLVREIAYRDGLPRPARVISPWYASELNIPGKPKLDPKRYFWVEGHDHHIHVDFTPDDDPERQRALRQHASGHEQPKSTEPYHKPSLPPKSPTQTTR